MAFVTTHECTRCGATADTSDLHNIRTRGGTIGQDCSLDVTNPDGHIYQSIQGMYSSLLFRSKPTAH